MIQINGHTRMAAVIGDPIKHSLSPFIHNQAFQETDVNAVYLAWEASEKNLVQILHNIRSLDMLGINLTMPYKQLAMWYPEELSDSARLIGAINTIVNDKGKLTGHNTDGIGFFRSLEAKYNFLPTDKTISIIGCGGAGLAIVVEAARNYAKEIRVFVRKDSNFDSLKKKLTTVSELTTCKICLYDLADTSLLQKVLLSSDLLVNATSAGMDGASSPVPSSLTLLENHLVADVIYKHLETPFLSWAKAQGARTENGVGMLLYQAAESFKLWTGKAMPTEIIEKELMHKLYDV